MPPPFTVDAAIARIRAYRAARGWSRRRLAIETQCVPALLQHMDRADWSPSTTTLRRLEAIIPDDFDPSALVDGRAVACRPPTQAPTRPARVSRRALIQRALEAQKP